MTDSVTSSFETPAQQRHAAAFGIWLFLATEVLFFGVLLTVYAVARSLHGDDFLAAARHSRLAIGTLNSVLLLTSSLMVSLAVKSEQLGQRRSVAPLLIVAIGLGMAFGAAKGVSMIWTWRMATGRDQALRSRRRAVNSTGLYIG